MIRFWSMGLETAILAKIGFEKQQSMALEISIQRANLHDIQPGRVTSAPLNKCAIFGDNRLGLRQL